MAVTIRSQLLFLVLAVLAPCMLGVAWLISSTYAAERSANERTLRDTARALSTVVEVELSQRTAVARVLAQSRYLDAGGQISDADIEGFAKQALRGLRGMKGWVELRANGRTLLDTRQGTQPLIPQAARVAASASSPAFVNGSGSGTADVPDVTGVAPPAVDGAQSLVRPLLPGALPGNAYAAVMEPVLRNGQGDLTLVLTLRPMELQALLDAQALPPGWIGAVIDSNGRVVARHPGGANYIGRWATPDLRARIADKYTGFFESVSLDGQETTAFQSTSSQGWTYVAAMPRAQFAGKLPQAVLRVVLGALVLTAFAVGGALWVSRRIVVAVCALKTAADALQAGHHERVSPTGIVECDQVGHALDRAGQALLDSRSDLERQVSAAVANTRAAEQRASNSQRVEALGRLTGGVAHDFNNMLGVISNCAHLIERHPASADMQMPLSALRRAVEAGSQLTMHLLRFAGRRALQPQTLDLARYLPELQDLMRSVLGRRVSISVRVAPGTAPVRVDPGELELALINLGLNARDAMPAGGEVRVVARNADAHDMEGLGGALSRRFVLISVSDDGVGIAPELLTRVFEPFFTTKPVGKGTGLGLSQVHGMCDQAGGKARLASTPGFGTTVMLLLPAGEDAPPAVSAPAAVAPARHDLAGSRVLLVEDNQELGDVTDGLLQAHGARVQRAADASQALHLLQADAQFDVVLSDVVMPGDLDGLALARRIRSEHPLLPVVLISGYNTAAVQTDFVVLSKPCEPAVLLDALRQAMALGRGPTQPVDR